MKKTYGVVFLILWGIGIVVLGYFSIQNYGWRYAGIKELNALKERVVILEDIIIAQHPEASKKVVNALESCADNKTVRECLEGLHASNG